MQGNKDRWQEDLFVACPLSSLVPEDHILKRVDKILDLSWVRELVRECYCQDNGRPSIDPESALRLMLAGFFQGIVHDRKLMREAQVNLAIRWFAGFRLDEQLPHHSSLTRIRQRWGKAVFQHLFERIVQVCIDTGLVNTDTVHIDATLIRADVSWGSIATRHIEQVVEENPVDEQDSDIPSPTKPGRPRTNPEKQKKYSLTDPDATMATSCNQFHLEPAYKQHTAVEDTNGIIVDVSVTTGEQNEGKQLPEQIDRIEQVTHSKIQAVTCDAGYAHPQNYSMLEERQTEAIIPPQRTMVRKKGTQRIPARRFKYSAQKDQLRCPAGNYLHRASRSSMNNGYMYRARLCDCKACPLRKRCISPKASVRQILIVDGYTALLRARRRKEKGWNEQTKLKYQRHRWQVEGVHGRAKTHHGLNRAVRRGLDNVSIQVYLTATVMNLKKVVMAGICRWIVLVSYKNPYSKSAAGNRLSERRLLVAI